MNKSLFHRLPVIATGLVVVALATLAAVGFARYGPDARAGRDSRLDVPAIVTATPTIPTNNGVSIDAGLARLSSLSPEWTRFVQAVTAGRPDEALKYLSFSLHECTANSARDGDAKRCEDFKVSDGTLLPMFPEDGRGAVPLGKSQEAGLWYRNEAQMSELLAVALVGRHPRIDLIASSEAPGLILSFAIDPVVLSPGGPLIASISFRADDRSVPTLQAFALGVASTTPFEALRGRERAGQTIEYWGISDELRARDAAIHSERYDSPAARATPMR